MAQSSCCRIHRSSCLTPTSHGVLRLTQCRHHIDAIGLASEFLDLRVLENNSQLCKCRIIWRYVAITHIKSHENIVLLQSIGQRGHSNRSNPPRTYLLITNSELALRLLVLTGESFELLDGLRLQDLDAKFDVALGVLVTGL